MKFLQILFCMLLSTSLVAQELDNPIPLDKAPIDLNNQASLQRGAKLYMNYCLGCHSLKYMRYNNLAQSIGITDAKGRVLEQVVKDNLIFSGDSITAAIRTALPEADAARWFGVVPPDLTLIAKVRGADWLYTYLRSFYYDPNRPWGANNLLVPNVAMPNILQSLRGERIPIYREKSKTSQKKNLVFDHLITVKRGTMTPLEFDSAMGDLVNFLTYVSEPNYKEREHLGIWVLLYLVIGLVLVYFLKKAYWKTIH